MIVGLRLRLSRPTALGVPLIRGSEGVVFQRRGADTQVCPYGGTKGRLDGQSGLGFLTEIQYLVDPEGLGVLVGRDVL